jgi:hypothetical protein
MRSISVSRGHRRGRLVQFIGCRPRCLMTLYRTRFSEQIELIKTAELPELWQEGA